MLEREAWKVKRSERIMSITDDMLDVLDGCDAEIVNVCISLPCVMAYIGNECIFDIEESGLFTDAEVSKDGDIEADGNERSAGMQLDQLLYSGYDGWTSSGRVHAAVIEPSISGSSTQNFYRDTHVMFKTTSGSSVRIDDRRKCHTPFASSVCDHYTVFPSTYGNHATQVASILADDLDDGQDPSITSNTEQRKRSGTSRETTLHMYSADRGSGETVYQSNVIEAIDHITSSTDDIPVVSMSTHIDGSDLSCTGTSVTADAVNSMFESGSLLFKAAGNDGVDGNNCTVSDPGAAISVFTVGAHDADNESDVRNGPIESYSSQGTTQRTIIDATGPGEIEFYASSTSNNGYLSNLIQGTSFSTPAVAGAAVDYIDYYKTERSSLIDDPGILFANMLLMGDRQSTSGKLTTDYSNRWGAGRLKMRIPEDGGLSGPWGYGSGWTCVQNGASSYININNGNDLGAGVDVVKAVAYWYDDRHGTYGFLDNVNMYLQRRQTGYASYTNVRVSNSSWDEKERVFYENSGNASFRIRLYGSSVTSDTSGCGTNSMKVFYAYFYESDDRGTSGDPGTEIDTE